MKYAIPALLAVLGCSTVQAAPGQWQSGWGQGKTEFFVGDEQKSYLNFACDANDEDSPISASATIAGQSFYSHDDKGGFDLIIDGVEYSNPFYVECNVCSQNFPAFWKALRAAKTITLSANGSRSSIPATGLNKLLKPLNAKDNPCGTGIW